MAAARADRPNPARLPVRDGVDLSHGRFRRRLAALAGPVYAQVRIDITEGVTDPLPIATKQNSTARRRRRRGPAPTSPQVVARANLARSGLFRPIDRQAFIQDPAASLRNGPRFGDWRVIDAQALVGGAVERQPDGRFRVEFRPLWDTVGPKQQMAGLGRYFTAHGQLAPGCRAHHLRRDL